MYHFDNHDRALVIDGFEQGIADNPYAGISDMRNINIVSIPGEGPVNFATSAITQQPSSGSVTSASSGADTVTLTGDTFDSGAAIVFSGGSLPGGIVAGTTYWAVGSSSVYQLYSDYGLSSLVDIASSGTGTWATINMGQPKYFTYSSQDATPAYWLVDATGYVWSNKITTSNSPFYWTYTGNKINNNSHGNGILYYAASDGTGYIFVFSNGSIDFTATSTVSWQYQWNWTLGTVGSYNANPTKVLNTASGTNNNHEALVGTDNRAYFTDANYIGRFYQTVPGTAFVPTTLTTYTTDQTAVLPFNDTAQCITQLGTNMLIGGKKNVIYPWDRFSSSNSYPILVAEHNIQKMVTVNTNTFALVGNRGRIYVTNGTQATLWRKIPDHISGTVEPYYIWGGLTSQKNQIYFSALVTKNDGSTAISQYGGVWAGDVDTKAIRLTNKLSYGTYGGYASAMIPNFSATPSGTGIFIGWQSGTTTYGIDTTVGTPYTGSQATIVSDLIPIGTFNMPRDFERVEYRLSEPMVAGESITINARLIFNTTDTGWTSVFTDSTAGNFANSQPFSLKNAQWLQLQAVLNSTASSPSYVRLKEFRITGLQGTGPMQQISI